MNLFTRERKLTAIHDSLIAQTMQHIRSIQVEFENLDYRAVASTGQAITANCTSLAEVDNELSDVSDMIESLKRIDKRMEELEREAEKKPS